MCVCVSNAEWAITATAIPFVGHSEKWTFLREHYTIGILGFGGQSVSIKSILYSASQMLVYYSIQFAEKGPLWAAPHRSLAFH